MSHSARQLRNSEKKASFFFPVLVVKPSGHAVSILNTRGTLAHRAFRIGLRSRARVAPGRLGLDTTPCHKLLPASRPNWNYPLQALRFQARIEMTWTRAGVAGSPALCRNTSPACFPRRVSCAQTWPHTRSTCSFKVYLASIRV